LEQPTRLGIESNGTVPHELTSGWIVAGVNELFTKEGKLDWLKEHEPVAMIGYSIWIYHISLDAANVVIRAELGSS
jgi:hypothetical protein